MGSREAKGGHIPGSGVQCQQVLDIMWLGAQRAPPAHWGERNKDHLSQPEFGLEALVKDLGCQAKLSLLWQGVGLK